MVAADATVKNKIPLNPPFSKGDFKPPFAKGGQGGFFIPGGETLAVHKYLILVSQISLGTRINKGVGRASSPASIIRTGWKACAYHY